MEEPKSKTEIIAKHCLLGFVVLCATIVVTNYESDRTEMAVSRAQADKAMFEAVRAQEEHRLLGSSLWSNVPVTYTTYPPTSSGIANVVNGQLPVVNGSSSTYQPINLAGDVTGSPAKK